MNIDRFFIASNIYSEEAWKKHRSAVEEWLDFKERWTSVKGYATLSLFNLNKL